MDAYLLRLGFTKSTTDPNLYIRLVKGEPIIILLYVEDLLITGVGNQIHECSQVWYQGSWDYALLLRTKSMEKAWWEYFGQGKYIIKILHMTTPMITNLKKLRSSKSIPVDPTFYR